MNSKRQLAAILFADVVGYTKLMQNDEAAATVWLRRFQDELKLRVKEHQGLVVNFYGDGALCTFSSPLDALRCAKALQSGFQNEPAVPVRMGIHMGTVVTEGDKVYGDSVNIASRIESMGIPGGILLSKKVREELKNQPDLLMQSLGSFAFKNVEEPIEVFALANEGFPIPKPKDIRGKLKTELQDSEGSFFQKLWNNRIPQILAVYILLAWLGLQLFDWALQQFGISPYWAQIFFISVIGVIPSLLVYLNNRERIHSSHLKVAEKILFPSNFLLVGVVLFFKGCLYDLMRFFFSIGINETDVFCSRSQISRSKHKKQYYPNKKKIGRKKNFFSQLQLARMNAFPVVEVNQ